LTLRDVVCAKEELFGTKKNNASRATKRVEPSSEPIRRGRAWRRKGVKFTVYSSVACDAACHAFPLHKRQHEENPNG
jgi:hypothetical protein